MSRNKKNIITCEPVSHKEESTIQEKPRLLPRNRPSRPGRMESSFSIGIVEDHRILRETLMLAMEGVEGFTILGGWENAEDAMAFVEKNTCDALVVDYLLPGMDGIAFTKRMRECSPETRIIMLSMVCDEDVILDAFEAGATGFLSKNSSIAELVDAIKRACEGTAVMSVELTKKVVNYASSIRRRALGKCELNEEQVHLLSLVCQGYENKDIVSIMNSSIATIKLRFHEINNLLRVKNKTQAVIEALRRGIITLDR